MSYLVLARKYRPRTFGEMVGQPHVVQALTNALTQGRLHHAYLFTGTRGVGKTTVSRILAKSLNCVGADGQGSITAAPCGVCQACRDIDAGRFVDYVELDAASNRGVDEISQLLDQAVYKPVLGRFKVYMIDEVHMLSNTAFNAMLKTLEEPPEYLKFVLATTDPQKVPVTVLSRCLQFNLRPMAVQTVQEHLQHVLEREAIRHQPGALRLLARAAHGSMRDALSLTDQAIAYGGGQLSEAAVREMLGAVDGSYVAQVARALLARDAGVLIDTIDELRQQGVSALGTLEELAELAQGVAVAQAIGAAPDTTDLQGEVIAQLASGLAADETQLLYSIALHGRAELPLAPDEYNGLMMVLLRCLAFLLPSGPAGRGHVAAAVDAAADVSQRGASAMTRMSGPSPMPPAAPSTLEPMAVAVAAEPSLRPSSGGQSAAKATEPALQVTDDEPVDPAQTELNLRWTELVARLIAEGSITALVRELAWQAQCIEVRDGGEHQLWRLRVEQQSLRSASHQERLQAAMSSALGHAVKLEIEAGNALNTPAQHDAQHKAARQLAAEELIQTDPLVLGLMQQFSSARIVPGSIKPL